MFKTTFSKYMAAFVVIVIISFTALSGLITFMLRSYAARETASELEITSTVIQTNIEGLSIEDLENYAFLGMLEMSILPLVNQHSDLDVYITDKNGKILLKTVDSRDGTGDEKETDVDGDLGKISIVDFKQSVNEQGKSFLMHQGTLGGLLGEERYGTCGYGGRAASLHLRISR